MVSRSDVLAVLTLSVLGAANAVLIALQWPGVH